MAKPGIPFSRLRQLLLDLAFTEVVVPESHLGFRQDDSKTEILLPIYQSRQLVAPRHLAMVRLLLDAKGLLAGAEFDQRLAADSVKHSAS